tara:strand:+ start:154 stop:357 length:204 start_codon:yes stop_codon:yes gene_type:complete
MDKKYEDKDYSIAVWDVTFYLVDRETDDPVLNDDGTVKEFHADDHIDCSYLSDSLDFDDLTEVKEIK